jgi:SAM-dependent methyltransferase
MPDEAWKWDETLFAGTAPYYVRGRLPYAAGMAQAIADAMELDGSVRLIDVGCGPGTIALRLAHLFAAVVGVDPDPGMMAEAEREAARAGITNVRWLRLRAEELRADLGIFRIATFSRSFHWMEREQVAATMLRMLEPDGRGAFVQVGETSDGVPEIDSAALPHPLPPEEAIGDLVRRYLGPDRRAGQGIRNQSPDGETIVVEGAGFRPPQIVRVTGQDVVERTVDDVVASVLSSSRSAPHLFGDRLTQFEADLRSLLAAATPTGCYAERTGDTELRIWRTPAA